MRDEGDRSHLLAGAAPSAAGRARSGTAGAPGDRRWRQEEAASSEFFFRPMVKMAKSLVLGATAAGRARPLDRADLSIKCPGGGMPPYELDSPARPHARPTARRRAGRHSWTTSSPPARRLPPARRERPRFGSVEMNVSPMQTWRIIQDLGIVYKQPKLELEKKDDYEEKKKKIKWLQESIICSFKKKILLGFEDETWLHLQPYITRTYMNRGEQQKILHKGI